MTENFNQTGTIGTPAAAPSGPAMAAHELPVSTVSFIAGRDVVETLGEVIGVVTRPRDMRPHPQAAQMLTASRQAAVRLMVAMAKQAGADAVIGLRFDGGKIADGASEVTAYGTAVRLSPAQTAPRSDSANSGASAASWPHAPAVASPPGDPVSAHVTPGFVDNDRNAAEAPAAPDETPAEPDVLIDQPGDERVFDHNPWTAQEDVHTRQIGQHHPG